MIIKMTFLISVLLLTGTIGLGQNVGKRSFVEIPGENLLVAFVNQPECPLKIENAKVILNTESNEVEFIYNLRNTSDKVIKSFTLSKWNVGGGGGDLAPVTLKPNRLLNPNQPMILGENKDIQIIKLDEKWRKKLKIDNEMLSVVILFVREVVFLDGSKFENETTVTNFVSFANRISFEK